MIQIIVARVSRHFVWIMGLLELVTVPLVIWLPEQNLLAFKSSAEGAVVGFAGIIILLFILNRLFSRLNLKVGEDKVISISLFRAALWNSIILALLFMIQNLVIKIDLKPVFINRFIAGFICSAGSLYLTSILYQLVTGIIPALGIRVNTSGNRFILVQMSKGSLAFLAGIYEAVALPVILIWEGFEKNQVVVSAVTGLTGGLTGAIMVFIIYNYTGFARLKISLKPVNHTIPGQ